MFGNQDASSIKKLDSYDQLLDANGELNASILSDYTINAQSLYEVVIEGIVYDVGGRANKVK